MASKLNSGSRSPFIKKKLNGCQQLDKNQYASQTVIFQLFLGGKKVGSPGLKLHRQNLTKPGCQLPPLGICRMQGDQTSQSERKSVLNIRWKD